MAIRLSEFPPVQRLLGGYPRPQLFLAPPNVQVHEGRMYLEEKLCVPTSLQGRVIRDHHTTTGHLISDCFWSEMSHRYEFGNPGLARKYTHEVGKNAPHVKHANAQS